MHSLVDSERLHRFMRALGSDPECAADADLLLVPDSDALLRAIQRLKVSLRMNVELGEAVSVPEHQPPALSRGGAARAGSWS